MSKREIEAKERAVEALQARLQELTRHVAQGQAAQARRKAQAIAAALGDTERRRGLERAREEEAGLRAELEDVGRLLAAERGAVAVSETARGRLLETRASLLAVREELAALAGEAAQRAALAARGGDLPADVVPAPLPCAVSSPLVPEELWSESGAGGEVPRALRSVCTSQAAVVALHRAATACAADLREGLRQWSFARCATASTRDLVDSLASELSSIQQEVTALTAGRDVLEKDLQASHRELESERQKNAMLLSRGELLADKLRHARDTAERFRADGGSSRREAQETRERLCLLGHEHEEVGRRLEVVRKALSEHPAEAARRTAAAAQLARRMQEQASRGLEELAQAQAEAASSGQGHAALKQACAAMNGRIEAERSALDSMSDTHAHVNLELEALARHYVAALPPLPGSDQPRSLGLPAPRRDVLPDSAPEGAHGPAGGLEFVARGAGGAAGTAAAVDGGDDDDRTYLSL